jgi:hypothetical protein
MKRTLLIVAVVFLLARAGLFEASGEPVDMRLVHAFLAKDKENKPATTFSADVLNIYLFWKGERLQAGDEIRVVWIAEDVGDASPKETKIGERSVTAHKPDEGGAISLSRPRSRAWPVGQYRTEIYLGKKLVEALRFTIRAGVNVEVKKSDD